MGKNSDDPGKKKKEEEPFIEQLQTAACYIAACLVFIKFFWDISIGEDQYR